MNRATYNLYDNSFAHEVSSVAGVIPATVSWDRTWDSPSLPLFVTNELMLGAKPTTLSPSKTFGWLLESQGIIGRVYSRVTRRMDDFDLVFTHSSRLLAGFPNARWIPGGGIWIGGTHAGGEMAVFDKSRSVSMLTTAKRTTALHRFRLRTARHLKGHPDCGVDVFLDPRQPYSFQALRDYRFNICIENYVDDGYFTERLLNCFATGTIPIYRGAPDIGRYFDPEGIIQFSSRRQLMDILEGASERDYTRRLTAVHANFERVMAYRSIEDFIQRSYLQD